MAKQLIFFFTEERRNTTERGDLGKVKGFFVLSDEKVAHRFWFSGGILMNNSMNK